MSDRYEFNGLVMRDDDDNVACIINQDSGRGNLIRRQIDTFPALLAECEAAAKMLQDWHDQRAESDETAYGMHHCGELCLRILRQIAAFGAVIAKARGEGSE